MIIYTQYTHEAQQIRDIDADFNEDGDKRVFVIRILHYNGRYLAKWEQQTQQIRDGYRSTLTIPTADYNGRTTLKDGRLSKAFLTKADTILGNNLDKYFNLWTAEKYQELCNEIHADFNGMK